jgi:hypothetical protein
VIVALLLSALVAGSAHAAPAAAPANPPITKDGVEITVLPQVSGGGGPATVIHIGLDMEAKTTDAVTRLGFESLRTVTEIDCEKGANRFISALAFDQPGLAGPSRARNVTGQWVQPSADSYMAAVISQVCAAHAAVATAPRPPPVVKEMAAAPPPSVPPPARVAVAAPSSAVAASETATAAPQPSPPQVVKFSGGRPVAAAPTAAPPPAAPAPPPAAPARAVAPPPSGPEVVRFSGAPAGAAPAPAAPSFIPKVAGDRIAQVAASASQHDAEKVLRELKGLIAPPLTTTIEQAQVGAAHVYRADVVGFASAADAKAFCRSAAQISKTCWVRAKGDEPAKPAAKPARPPERLRPAKPAG